MKQLRYFEAIALHGHFGRAAKACSISQPAISVQIKELEETLGQALFERYARQIRLTAFGEAFAARVKPILRAMDDLGDFARTAQDGLIGRLRIGVIPTVAPYLLPGFVADLATAYPKLDMRFRETQTQTLIGELLDGRLDMAVLALPTSEPALQETALFEERFVLVRSAQEAHLPVPNGKSLAKMRLLLLEEGHCFRDQALAFCKVGANVPRESMEGSSLSTLVQMVASGLGVTLIPEMAIGVETQSTNVSVAQFENPKPKRTIGLVWRKTTPMAEQFHEVAKVMKRSANGALDHT